MSGPLDGMKVIGFDLETTGFDCRSERIVEYALVGSDSSGQHISQCSLVDPERKIPSGATNVHGISNDDVSGAGTFSEHSERISDMMEGAIIVGHNVIGFDWGFIQMEYLRAGIEAPRVRGFIDTLKIARRLRVPGRHRLGDLCDRYGIDLNRAHRADADASASLLLLWNFMREFPEKFEISLDELIETLD
ncbi:MAG: 3'-5' exonuclease [Candidatus Thalassarchaeaceae archaeon]|nr:3'-5' exonuclease [Candidatus Thalassarchaeaceae archaeon]